MAKKSSKSVIQPAVVPSTGNKITFGDDSDEGDANGELESELELNAAGPSKPRRNAVDQDDEDEDEDHDDDDDAPEAVGVSSKDEVSREAEFLAE
jgi:hypothetical protein